MDIAERAACGRRRVPPVTVGWSEDRHVRFAVAIEVTDKRLIPCDAEVRVRRSPGIHAANARPRTLPEKDEVRLAVAVEVGWTRCISVLSKLMKYYPPVHTASVPP